MSATVPSFLEDHISQVPALQVLMKLGYTYLRPQEIYLERKGRLSNVVLENILAQQLRRLNRVNYRGADREFSEGNILAAVQALKDIPFDGLVRTSEKFYDLLSLGKSFEERFEDDVKSFTLRYVDWENPANNVFHVAEEFEVERVGSSATCRPDIVLFVNGIPFVVTECKRPDLKDALAQAVSQHLRNQSNEHIPRLFALAQMLLAVSKNEATMATTGTASKFWSQWREDDAQQAEIFAERIVRQPLTREQIERLFAERFRYVREYFAELEATGREVTGQDRALCSLCTPERLIELSRKFIVFDNAEKKIARYQQYFAVQATLKRIRKPAADGQRPGGVVWHTQGSGKSLTMVMLAKSLALEPSLVNPRIVLVTDRVDLDDQIWTTFHHCGKDPVQAKTGKHLLELVSGKQATIITTVIDKFEAATRYPELRNDSAEIFVLVDESHRSQYGENHALMQRVLPKACYIGFTGTPLMKQEKNTAQKFGGFIHTYAIRQAVTDKAVVPLLYEGRHALQEVDQKSIDKWFTVTTAKLNDAQRADLKKKFATTDAVNASASRIYQIAYDISEHFAANWKGTPFKAQLATYSRHAALQYKKALDEFGKVSSEVLISGPDTREGNEDVYDVGRDEIQAFWKRMMERYGTDREYNKQLISAFKTSEQPEIIIVVDKLLTGFDAPRNTVLYLDKKLEGHNLLQAIARVNRLFDGKDFGFILDYRGVIKELGEALDLYGSLQEFDNEDVEESLTNIAHEIASLPQRHSDLWDVFKEVKKRLDEEEYERHLADTERREEFYKRLSLYSRTLAIALSSARFLSETPMERVDTYKRDLAFFQKLRSSVRLRFADEVDYRDYQPLIRKLIDTHVHSNEILTLTEPVNIFEEAAFEAELAKLKTPASKADTIAHRTQKTITARMDEDPIFYRKFSKILQDVIEAYREQRVSDAEYLKKVSEVMESIRNRLGSNVPSALRERPVAQAFFDIASSVFGRLEQDAAKSEKLATEAAIHFDEVVQRCKVRDWTTNLDVQNEMRNAMDDFLFDLKSRAGLALTAADMDAIVENILSIAKKRYG